METYVFFSDFIFLSRQRIYFPEDLNAKNKTRMYN
jgi:hypothetical protein